MDGHADDPGLREACRRGTADNKAGLAGIIHARTGIVVDPATLFDMQAKRMISGVLGAAGAWRGELSHRRITRPELRLHLIMIN